MNQILKIAILDTNSLGDVILSSLQSLGHLQCLTKQQVTNIAPDTQIIISNKVEVDQALIDQLPKLQLICVAATGYNNIDLAAAQQANIPVCNVAGYSTNSVAQHVFALLLGWSNKIKQYHQASKQGQWSESDFFSLLDYPTFDLTGKTMGIFGYGAIGQQTAKLAQAFGMNVIVAERQAAQSIRQGRSSYQQTISQADVISLHNPLTEQSKNMVNQQFLSEMKDDAILINTARGGLIDEAALKTALQHQQIQAALLDGLSTEPPPADHILLQTKLDNLIITPHTAWASSQARQRLVEEIALNIQHHLTGKARNIVSQL